MSVLFFHTMRYKLSAPKDPSSDRLILSKGHAAPICKFLYFLIQIVFHVRPKETTLILTASFLSADSFTIRGKEPCREDL